MKLRVTSAFSPRITDTEPGGWCVAEWASTDNAKVVLVTFGSSCAQQNYWIIIILKCQALFGFSLTLTCFLCPVNSWQDLLPKLPTLVLTPDFHCLNLPPPRSSPPSSLLQCKASQPFLAQMLFLYFPSGGSDLWAQCLFLKLILVFHCLSVSISSAASFSQ